MGLFNKKEKYRKIEQATPIREVELEQPEVVEVKERISTMPSIRSRKEMDVDEYKEMLLELTEKLGDLSVWISEVVEHINKRI